MVTQEHLSLLAGASRAATREDWEKAAADVLRKSGRMKADDPDALVWQKLTRTTLDGVEVAPLGTPELVVGVPDPRASPARRRTPAAPRSPARGGLGRPRPPRRPRRRAGRGRRPRRPGERRHQPLAQPRPGRHRGRGPRRPCSRTCCSTSPRSCWTAPSDPVGAAQALVRPARRARASTPRPAPASAATRSAARCAAIDGDREARWSPRPRPGARRASTACWRSPSTAPPSTTSARPTPRSSATALAVGAAYLRILTERTGLDVDDRRATDRVPLRRDRRAVPDDRQAARGPPAVAPGARALRRRRRARPGAARRDAAGR